MVAAVIKSRIVIVVNCAGHSSQLYSDIHVACGQYRRNIHGKMPVSVDIAEKIESLRLL